MKIVTTIVIEDEANEEQLAEVGLSYKFVEISIKKVFEKLLKEAGLEENVKSIEVKTEDSAPAENGNEKQE